MSSNNRDLVHLFASHTAGLTYDQLPDEARSAAKKSILDTLGVILLQAEWSLPYVPLSTS